MNATIDSTTIIIIVIIICLLITGCGGYWCYCRSSENFSPSPRICLPSGAPLAAQGQFLSDLYLPEYKYGCLPTIDWPNAIIPKTPAYTSSRLDFPDYISKCKECGKINTQQKKAYINDLQEDILRRQNLVAYHINFNDNFYTIFLENNLEKAIMTKAGDLSTDNFPGIKSSTINLNYIDNGDDYFDIKVSYLIRHNISLNPRINGNSMFYPGSVGDFSYTPGGAQKRLFTNNMISYTINKSMMADQIELYLPEGETVKSVAGDWWRYVFAGGFCAVPTNKVTLLDKVTLIADWIDGGAPIEYIMFLCNLYVLLSGSVNAIGWNLRTNDGGQTYQINFYKQIEGNNLRLVQDGDKNNYCNFINLDQMKTITLVNPVPSPSPKTVSPISSPV